MNKRQRKKVMKRELAKLVRKLIVTYKRRRMKIQWVKYRKDAP